MVVLLVINDDYHSQDKKLANSLEHEFNMYGVVDGIKTTGKGYSFVTLNDEEDLDLDEALGGNAIQVTADSGYKKKLDEAFEEYLDKCKAIVSGEEKKASPPKKRKRGRPKKVKTEDNAKPNGQEAAETAN